MKESRSNDHQERMLRVLVHLQRHLDEDLSLKELARVACFSPYHFHHIFTGMMGESLKEHVRRLRLERAATQLKLGEQSVTNIALDAGYQNHESFTRAFRAAFGVAPSRFRSAKSPRAAIAARSGVHYRTDGKLSAFKPAKQGADDFHVTVKTLKPMRVAFMRHTGPYDQVGTTWDKLLPLLGKEGFLGGDTLFIGIPHDDPDVTQPHRLRYDACVSVDAKFQPRRNIGAQTIEGGDYAVATHFGPYAKLSGSYARLLGQWLPRSGRELRALPCFEIYLNSPEGTDPEDLITDIHAPLEPRRAGAGRI
jgi:AraC family transcriptional regulator